MWDRCLIRRWINGLLVSCGQAGCQGEIINMQKSKRSPAKVIIPEVTCLSLDYRNTSTKDQFNEKHSTFEEGPYFWRIPDTKPFFSFLSWLFIFLFGYGIEPWFFLNLWNQNADTWHNSQQGICVWPTDRPTSCLLQFLSVVPPAVSWFSMTPLDAAMLEYL